MTFMIKKKRYKFVVDLVIDELTEVSYSKGIMFAKIRQLDGGSFSDVSKRVEVQNHAVKYNDRFIFPCKMFASSASVILETCKCRISIRMEEKGGKHFRKIGFADVNMAEYAGAGTSTQKYILQAYDTRHRLDNSMLQITLNITLKEGDTIFQRPLNRSTPYVLPGEEESQESGSTPPSSKSLTVVPTSSSDLVKQLTHSPSLSTVPSSSMTSGNIMSTSVGCIGIEFSLEDNNHTRNSSATSQTSAGYISSSNGGMVPPHHPPVSSGGPPTAHLQGHSRQSSSGDSCHGRNLSQGSSDTGFYGSMEKEKSRRKKLDEGRVDPELVIKELMEGVDLDKVGQDDAETSGLQLFVGKDGTFTFDKSSSRKKDYEPVVML